MGRKASFDKISAVKLFKEGFTYSEIAEKLKTTPEAVKMTIKRNASELRKNSTDKYKVIELFKGGLNYKKIAKKFDSTEDAIRMIIKRNVPELIEKPIDESIELFKDGYTYKEIAEKLNSTEDAIRMLLNKYAPEEVKKRRSTRQSKIKDLFEPTEEEFKLQQTGALTIEDRKELMNERTYGINFNESISPSNFVKYNRQSYITDKKGTLHFDKTRGHITKDVPPSYRPPLMVP